MRYIDSEYVRAELEAGTVDIVPAETAKALSDNLDKLPWFPTRLRWPDLPASTTFNLDGLGPDRNGEDLLRWFAKTRAGCCPCLILVLTSEDMLIGKPSDILLKIDYLAGPGTGNYPLIGALKVGKDIIADMTAVMEKHQSDLQAVSRLQPT